MKSPRKQPLWSTVFGWAGLVLFTLWVATKVTHLPRLARLLNWGAGVEGSACVVGLPVWFVYKFISTARSNAADRLRASRRARGLCEACGYDLRSSAGPCPECGATVTPPTW